MFFGERTSGKSVNAQGFFRDIFHFDVTLSLPWPLKN